MNSPSTSVLELLSSREKEVLALIKNGKSREEIAHFMGISKLTYDSYRKAIRIKLRIKSQADWPRILTQF